MKDREKESC